VLSDCSPIFLSDGILPAGIKRPLKLFICTMSCYDAARVK
jgi:hypothetical protein